ncbi:uncharacterized protein LOC104582080 [Brachypodium distachyon]|uniref:uncharacterized protein LOC104582080 n=1 Tax=Brachypodium distachyon TaxID=15368 RepID=UPI00052FE227|nr:uncharacterized protein LOC104582080 [Brachypodium distachyon]|eukprot:XP_010229690.1 uncharacterized protein LOC104582080 [Brachypodium distachyon]
MMNKVFVDGERGLNLIYADTLRGMNRSMTKLPATDTTFHGIIPGKAAMPLGRISLDVVFGSPDNFRCERLDFEVVNWPSQYHVVLSRVALARFMAVSHYAYLKLKMLGPDGVITVSGNFTHSDNCDKEFHKIYESFGMHEVFEQLKASTGLEQSPVAKNPAHQPEFNKKADTKEVQVHPTDPSKTVIISTSLPPA